MIFPDLIRKRPWLEWATGLIATFLFLRTLPCRAIRSSIFSPGTYGRIRPLALICPPTWIRVLLPTLRNTFAGAGVLFAVAAGAGWGAEDAVTVVGVAVCAAAAAGRTTTTATAAAMRRGERAFTAEDCARPGRRASSVEGPITKPG